MVRVIAPLVALIIIAAIVAAVVVYHRRKTGQETALSHGWATKGDLSRAEEAVLRNQNATAAMIFRRLRNPGEAIQLDDVVVLPPDAKQRIDKWLTDYEKGKVSKQS